MSNLQRLRNSCYGIECFMRSQGLKVTSKTVGDLTSEFLKYKGLPYTKFNSRYKGMFKAGECNAPSVQEYFGEFKLYVINKVKNSEQDNNQML